MTDESAPDPQSDPYDSSTAEPATFEPERASVLTPMGQVESLGSFARGLGARRVKLMIAVAGGLALLFAILNLFA